MKKYFKPVKETVNQELSHEHITVADSDGNQYSVAVTRYPFHTIIEAININQLR